jgi:hypothetical protein
VFDASNGLDANQFAVFRYESEIAVFNLTDRRDLLTSSEAQELVPVLNCESEIDSPAVAQEERKMNGIVQEGFGGPVESPGDHGPFAKVTSESSHGIVSGVFSQFEHDLGIFNKDPQRFLFFACDGVPDLIPVDSPADSKSPQQKEK